MEKAEALRFCLDGIRRRPDLPGRCQPSTFGAKRLNFCVRDGYRWFPLAIVTGIVKGLRSGRFLSVFPVWLPSRTAFSGLSVSCFALLPFASLAFGSLSLSLRFLPSSRFAPSKPHSEKLTSNLLRKAAVCLSVASLGAQSLSTPHS